MESKHATKAVDARILCIATAIQANTCESPIVQFARQPCGWQPGVIAMPPASSVIGVVTRLWERITSAAGEAEFVAMNFMARRLHGAGSGASKP
jgi:hypothetical protein